MKSTLNTDRKKVPRWRYVYCIIPSKSEQDFGRIGIKGESVYTVHYKDIAAVVSNSLDKSYEVLEEGITHQKVVESIQKDFCLVPMAFGQVSTEADVKMFLSTNYHELKGILEKLDGKVELGLKVSWKMDAIMREIVTSNDRIRILNKQISLKPEDRTYHLRIELGKMVAEELEKKRRRIASTIYKTLRAISVDSNENKPLSDEMILNAAFLVGHEKENEFDEMVNTIEAEYGEKVNMKYVISPPYNFVNLRLGR
ncbi:MAG: GvpL/GvpF family gas vesicle protein [Methanophagales archaeon]|nr:GvpL/GvpF family gas vesicle protein [Methanophagales archaeon]